MQRKTLILCGGVALFLAAAPAPALSPPDPPINSIQSQGIVGLDFSRSANDERIAIMIINNNHVTGFDVFFKFTNGCSFKSGAVQEIPMTALVLDEVSGTLGTGLTAPNDIDILHNLSGGDEYTWDPGAAQTTETINYIVELRANWDNPAGKLAGFYSETITIVITPGL
ncbi:MAG: hypothetical protein JW768_03745 [Chitinispirillaceae bacterium]|nr:hypothetical protein [Chitinispirillaceae bacterium]